VEVKTLVRHVHPRRLQIYRVPNSSSPFAEWLESIQDKRTQSRIQARLDRLETGNFGDCHPVGEGVFELRLHFGAGYRIYFGEVDNTIVLLLCAGDKSSQTRDIERAKDYWLQYKETHR
jgi:putative addiction module killer protein